MNIIPNNTTLLQHIPNVVETVEGETPLFDKILPQLTATEQWLSDAIVGNDLMQAIAAEPHPPMFVHAANAIACEAFRRSVPSLDIILTANGFGIVSNSNVAPASKERVERLIASLADQRDKSLAALLDLLKKNSMWLNSDQGAWFASSFFVSPKEDTAAAKAVLKNADGWDAFLELREKARPIEQAYEEKWFGKLTMEKLRTNMVTDPQAAGEHAQIARTVRQLIINEMLMGKRPVKGLDRCVNFIRNHPQLFPEWRQDPVAELFADKWRFQNKKEAAGYFF